MRGSDARVVRGYGNYGYCGYAPDIDMALRFVKPRLLRERKEGITHTNFEGVLCRTSKEGAKEERVGGWVMNDIIPTLDFEFVPHTHTSTASVIDMVSALALGSV